MDSHKLLVEDVSSSSTLENIKTLCQIYQTAAFTSYKQLQQAVKYGIVGKPWLLSYGF